MMYRNHIVSFTMEFSAQASADDWLDAMIEEYDGEYDFVSTSISGGTGEYIATITFTGSNLDGPTSIVSEGSGEPDLFQSVGSGDVG